MSYADALADLKADFGKKKLLTPAEIAPYIGRSASAIASLRSRKGFPPAKKEGGKVVVSIYALAHYIGDDEPKHDAPIKAEELIQERARALAKINLAEAGRRVAAMRRAKTHFRREHPIACFRLAEKAPGRLSRHHVERQRERSEGVEQVEVRLNEGSRTAAHERRFERGAGGAARSVVMRRLVRIAVVVRSGRRSRSVTRRLLRAAVANAEVAVREAEHLRCDPNQQCCRRKEAEQRTER